MYLSSIVEAEPSNMGVLEMCRSGGGASSSMATNSNQTIERGRWVDNVVCALYALLEAEIASVAMKGLLDISWKERQCLQKTGDGGGTFFGAQTCAHHLLSYLCRLATAMDGGNIPHTPATQSQHHDDSNGKDRNKLGKNNNNVKS